MLWNVAKVVINSFFLIQNVISLYITFYDCLLCNIGSSNKISNDVESSGRSNMWGFNFVAPLAVARACAHSPERHSMKTLRSILCSLALGIGWCIRFLDYDYCLANIIFTKIEMKGFFGSLLVLTSLCYLKTGSNKKVL